LYASIKDYPLGALKHIISGLRFIWLYVHVLLL